MLNVEAAKITVSSPPCLVSTSQDVKDSAFQFFVDCYKADTFVTSVGKIMIPKDSQLVRDSAIEPAATVRQAGKPIKRHIRSRGETGGKARKAYKGGKCGKTDHNQILCRVAGL